MKPSFHYVVKAKLIRYKNADDISFLEFEEKFENEIPIVARDEAFNYYQNYIDVLLESKGKDYISDKQTRIEFQTFIETGTYSKLKIVDGEMDWNDSIGNGIGIYLVIDNSVKDNNRSLRYKKGEEYIIHGIVNFIGDLGDFDSIVLGLGIEYELYKFYKYDTKDKERKIVYCDRGEWEEGYTDDEPSTYTILETTIDWTGFDKPYWWGRPEEDEKENQSTSDLVNQIIKGGEGRQVEFKSTMRYHLNLKRADKTIEHEVAKTLAGFLNSFGGLLIIGVDDDRNVIGLESDFKMFNKNSEDNFYKAFRNILKNFFGLGIAVLLNYDFTMINEKIIFLVYVTESSKPVYLNNYGVKEFYVRVGTTSSLYDVEEAVNYVTEKWYKKTSANDPQ